MHRRIAEKFKYTNTEGLEGHCALPLGDWIIFVLHRAGLTELLSLLRLEESANKKIKFLHGNYRLSNTAHGKIRRT